MYQGSILRASWSTGCHKCGKRDNIILLQYFCLHERSYRGTAYEEKQVAETEYESVEAAQLTVFQIQLLLKLNAQEYFHGVPLIYGLSIAGHTLVWCSGPSWWTLNPSTRIRIPARALNHFVRHGQFDV